MAESNYYNLEKAAEVLGVSAGELNRLREKGKIRAFRDGSAWKFRKEDIDNHLADTIKARSSSSSLDDDGLLTDESDEDELPTMMADTNTFDQLADTTNGIEISARETDNDVVADDGNDIILGGGTAVDERSPGSSSISLGDDDDDDDFGSGISILDDDSPISGSNIDLASDSGISIDDSGISLDKDLASQSGSGSGISILAEDEEAPVQAAADDFELDDLELDPLPSDMGSEPKPTADFDKPSETEQAQEDSELFELQPLAEEAPAGDTYGIASDDSSQESTSTRELELEDDTFQLEATDDAQDSDSESSSQMLDLDAESTVKPLDAETGNSEAGGDPFNFQSETGDNFGTAEGFGDGFGSDFNGDFGGAAGGESFGEADASAGDVSAESPFGQSGDGSEIDFQESGQSDVAVKQKVSESGFSGLGIGLGLVPCILLLLLAGIGTWELIRSMWNWDGSFSLTGPVLETIGGILKLF